MAAAGGDGAAHERRKLALSSLSGAATKTLLAINCIIPGRTIPTTKICVDDKVKLRDVLAAWAEGVMKVQDGEIPAAARARGISGAGNLNLDSSLRSLRPKLPVREGRLTVKVDWPAEQLNQKPPLADGASRPAAQAASVVKAAGSSKELIEKAKKDRAREKAELAKQKAKEKAVRERAKMKERAKKEKKQLKDKAKKEKKRSKDKAEKAKERQVAQKAKDAVSEEAKKAKTEARAKRKAEKELEAAKKPRKDAKEGAEAEGQAASSSESSSDSDSSSDSEDANAGALSRFLSDSSGGESP